MVTGQLPMEESESKDMLRKMLKRSFGAIKPLSDHRYAPEEELGRIIEKMMKIDLKARYQNMDDVVADLERYEHSTESTGPAPQSTGEARGRRSRIDPFAAAKEPSRPLSRPPCMTRPPRMKSCRPSRSRLSFPRTSCASSPSPRSRCKRKG